MALPRRVAICEKMMMPAATIQVTSIEFVIPKPPNWTSICGFNETPSCSVAPASAAKADVASIALEANARIDISKQRLRIFISTAVTDIGDASLPRSSAFVPHSRDYGGKAAPATTRTRIRKRVLRRLTNKILGRELIWLAILRQIAERFVRLALVSPAQRRHSL